MKGVFTLRNKKLFTYLTLILVLGLVLMACGKGPEEIEGTGEDSGVEIHEEGEKKEPSLDLGRAKEQDENRDEDQDKDQSGDQDRDQDKAQIRDDKPLGEESSSLHDSVSKDTPLAQDVKPREETSPNKDKESPSSTGEDTKKPRVTISIEGPEDAGTILGETEVDLEEGDTVFDILAQVVKDKKIQMDYMGRKSSVYIQGIDNIYEFDYGAESGWIFRVNGEVSQISSSSHKLEDGDIIEWLYTVKLGKEYSDGGGE